MCRQPLQVILHADTRGSSRVEARQAPVFERKDVVVADEFHEHVADQDDEVLGVAGLIVLWDNFD